MDSIRDCICRELVIQFIIREIFSDCGKIIADSSGGFYIVYNWNILILCTRVILILFHLLYTLFGIIFFFFFFCFQVSFQRMVTRLAT